MYEICKKQYERKAEKGTLTNSYAEKQRVCLGIFLMYEQLSQEEYEELMDLLNTNVPEENTPT